MDITEKLLTANGWELDTDYRLCPGYRKLINKVMRVVILFSKYQPTYPAVSLLIQHGYLKALPSIRTMEQLALLFALLGDEPETGTSAVEAAYPYVKKLSELTYSTALETRLPAALVPVATPPGLRVADRAIKEMGEMR